ncbi:prolyl oligopeptidase family serine peptidase [Pedobacter steynii]|uniref:Peptidase S9 prolyl oligopeptidase catalytic domain-containing protein n=1 Tax=Pedobacter steynii TaxID=430522 RepID=A0A1D7QND3_9SPHI|nr:prolyl oligopeptidase family serine peptidase [Pedobacter steynii]AOM80153.1 hypothetical protein BFS30_25130 [Pedobacter steynii]
MNNIKNAHHFKSGLIANNCNNYKRQITYTDYITYLLGKNQLNQPKAKQSISDKDQFQEIKWQTIQAQEDNKFHAKELATGCIYLAYHSDQEQNAILNVSGHRMLYLNGVPHNGDMYTYGWMYLPVKLKKGINELFILGSTSDITATLLFPFSHAMMSLKDTTFPHVIFGEPHKILTGGLIVINSSDQPLTELSLVSRIAGKERTTKVPAIPPLTFRKVAMEFDTSGMVQRGVHKMELQLLESGNITDQNAGEILVVEPNECHSNTFISEIDNSVQYYSIVPQSVSGPEPPALILALHGREVFSLNLAHAHRPKNWGLIAIPTNRRPRGFTWEDWGRLDAMEVLNMVKEKFKVDHSRVYLTGHSMGGRGTWYLGATYPGTWAAIAPCAGYATTTLRGTEKEEPIRKSTNIEQLMRRAGNASNVLELMNNYKASGVFILHGDDDEIIPVDYSRRMKKLLAPFHHDLSYQEHRGGSHWYGNESVDSESIFDYFKPRSIPVSKQLNHIDFSTANPAISSTMHWLSIVQQKYPLKFSRIKADRDLEKKNIEIYTEDVLVCNLSLADFNIADTITITIDDCLNLYQVKDPEERIYFYKNNEKWTLGPDLNPELKGPHRYGTFKEAFKNRMVFVYGTSGTEEENNWNYNKARYDAETWYYRANGAVEMLSDKQFKASVYAHRGVVLYGNNSNNSAWEELLADCPIKVQTGLINIGETTYTGDDHGIYFVWPRADSPTALVAVISGSGMQGMRAAESCQYFHHQAQFPDFMVFNLDFLVNGLRGVKLAGFFGNDWSLENGELVENDQFTYSDEWV